MQPGKTDPDLPLLRAVAAGDAGALNELYQRHGLHILNYLIGQLQDRQLAEDVLHNVMLVMWRKAADFRGDSTVRTWMFGIARLQTLRARQNQHNRITELYDESQPGGDEPPQTVEHLLEHEALEDAIRNLPHSQQQALTARAGGEGARRPSKWMIVAGLFFVLDLSVWHYSIVMTSVAANATMPSSTPRATSHITTPG